METVYKGKLGERVLKFNKNLLEETYEFKIYGQIPERSMEDRSVYFEASPQGWLNGEDAIELGQALIEQGTISLKANMINHQLNYCNNKLQSEIAKGNIEKIIVERLTDKNPVGYGTGFYIYLIKPIYISNYEGYEMKSFEIVLYSECYNNLKKDLKKWLKVEVELIDKFVEKNVKENNSKIEYVKKCIREASKDSFICIKESAYEFYRRYFCDTDMFLYYVIYHDVNCNISNSISLCLNQTQYKDIIKLSKECDIRYTKDSTYHEIKEFCNNIIKDLDSMHLPNGRYNIKYEKQPEKYDVVDHSIYQFTIYNYKDEIIKQYKMYIEDEGDTLNYIEDILNKYFEKYLVEK